MKSFELMCLVQARVKGIINKLLFFLRSWFFDVEYDTISLEELEHWLNIWKAEELPKLAYTPERFDCDDFAGYFKYWFIKNTKKNCIGRAIGKVYYINEKGEKEFIGYHAWNLAVLDSGNIVNIEPQTGDYSFTDEMYNWIYEVQAVIF